MKYCVRRQKRKRRWVGKQEQIGTERNEEEEMELEYYINALKNVQKTGRGSEEKIEKIKK